jgi:hypothetical protein
MASVKVYEIDYPKHPTGSMKTEWRSLFDISIGRRSPSERIKAVET